jgi:mannonate dehydratase
MQFLYAIMARLVGKANGTEFLLPCQFVIGYNATYYQATPRRDGMADQPAHDAYALKTIPGFFASRPGIQIGTQLAADASNEDIQFVKQLGVEWITTGLSDPRDHTIESYVALRRRFERHGLRIYRIANPRCQNVPEIILNLPGREERIVEMLTYIRNLGAAGIYHATYAHQANGIWRTGPEPLRGGALHSAFRLNSIGEGSWGGRSFSGSLTHGREYACDELWDNYIYFIRQVVPVAEAAGVYIGVHPDDPPVYPLGGIPRCIFGNFAGFVRALEIANSPNLGMSLCVGSWLEGGEAMGRDVVQAIHHFGGRRKLFHVHFRNITAPLPEGFIETYLDDGYMDMHKVMAALREVGFDGVMISDHLPNMVGGRRAAEAFSIGYMKALIQAVDNTLGAP